MGATMPPQAPTPGLIVWSDAERDDTVRAVIERTELPVVGIGGPPGDDAPRQLAEQTGHRPFDDLRAACASAGDACVLIAAPADAAPIPDPRRVVSLFPIPSRVADLGAGSSAAREDPGSDARLAPCLRCSYAMRAGTEIIEAFGPVRSMAMRSLGSPDAGSLGARLLDAMDMLRFLCGEPELIDGAYSPGERSRLVHGAAPERLDRLSGDMTINARFADGRGACLALSDRAPRGLETHLVALGSSGRLDVTPFALCWTAPDGSVTDRIEAPSDLEVSDPMGVLVACIVEQLSRATMHADGLDALRGYGAALAMSEAALLSARTGESESPSTILRMVIPG